MKQTQATIIRQQLEQQGFVYVLGGKCNTDRYLYLIEYKSPRGFCFYLYFDKDGNLVETKIIDKMIVRNKK